MTTVLNSAQINGGFPKFLFNGLLTGVIAAVLNNVWSLIYTSLTGFAISDLVNVISITLASLIPILVGSVVYFGLSRFIPGKATLLFIIGSLVLVLLSLSGPLSPTLPDGTPTPAGFAGLTIPMHLVAGLTCAFLLPRFIARNG